ncbi:MAG: hypothetical protein IT204_09415 [Fimbriimonadaceae bacterium]|nr:hypothetical protein [Fimbriimonadaceae bacterium]
MPYFLAFALLAAGPPELRFEAEAWSTPTTAWLANKDAPDRWNLWSTDVDAEKKWSGGVVLRAPVVNADRATPEEGAPVLHTRLTGLKPGRYDVELKVGRTLGVSLDGGQTWRPYSGGLLLEMAELGETFEVWVDDRYVNPGGAGSGYYDYVALWPLVPAATKPALRGHATRRLAERLDRGLVAIPADGGMQLSWRLLASDPAAVGFNVYRAAAGQLAKLHPTPLTATTDFRDPTGQPGQEYRLRTVVGGREQPGEVTCQAQAQPYLKFPLGAGTTVQKLGLGDLDGDGRLDYVLKTPQDNIDPYISYWQPSPGTYTLRAINADGRELWSYDLGWAIERGIWYSPYLVWDLDGDGRAEVAVKAGEGDPRDPEDQRVRSGAEWLVVLDGRTGQPRAKAPWPSREGFGDLAGAASAGYNYAARNQLAVAYLDGATPYLIALRGTYTTMKAEAWELVGDQLQPGWTYSSDEAGRRWRGQGAHFTHCADLDGDGRDEVMLGSAVIDDTGVPLWSTGRGHPDHSYVGDLDPLRPGWEVYYVYETGGRSHGMSQADAKTGQWLWGLPTPSGHVHGGFCADIDPVYPGSEGYGAETEGDHKANGRRWWWTAQGELLTTELDYGMGVKTALWDADLQREVVRGSRVLDHLGGQVSSGIDGSQIMYADLIGDWREEIVTASGGELRIYVSPIPAFDRRVCLLQDDLYRRDVAIGSQAYYQVATLSTALEATAVNLNLTALAAQPGTVQVVVSAPLAAGLSGEVRLSGGGLPADSRLAVQLAAGKRLVEVVKLPLGAARGETTVSAALHAGGIVRQTAVTLRLPDQPRAELPRAEAEAFVAQGGGEVQKRSDKINVAGQAISHWDAAGHWLEWTLKAPRAGDYQLLARYCFSETAVRGGTLDGQPLPDQSFPATSGNGADAVDWAHWTFRDAQGGPLRLKLAAGEHRLRLENRNGKGLNLDYLALQPLG